jgi:hypothetical protein
VSSAPFREYEARGGDPRGFKADYLRLLDAEVPSRASGPAAL